MSFPQSRLGRALSRILWTQLLWQKQWDPLEAVTSSVPAEGKGKGALLPRQPVCVTHPLHPVQHLLRGAPSSISEAKEHSAVVHTSFILVVLHCFQHLEGILHSYTLPVPSPSSHSSTQESCASLWGAKSGRGPLPHPKPQESGTDTSQRQAPDCQEP